MVVGNAARLDRAYRSTSYQAGPAAKSLATARIGRRSASIDAVLKGWRVRQAAFIAASNPLSRRMPQGWNARRTGHLLQVVRAVPHLQGVGQGTGWAEPHVLVAVPPARAIVLARRFRQAAIVLVEPGRRARLLVLPGRLPVP